MIKKILPFQGSGGYRRGIQLTRIQSILFVKDQFDRLMEKKLKMPVSIVNL